VLLYRFEIGVGLGRVEDLVAVHDRDEVLDLAEVDDVVGVAREHVDALDVVAGDFELDHLVGAELALLDEAMAGDDDKELPLGVVPVLPFGNAGLRDIDRDLAAVEGVDQLGKGAAVVDIHLDREGDLFLREVAEVGAVELLGEAAGRDLRDHQRLRLLGEGFEQLDDFAEGDLVGYGDIAIAPFDRLRDHLQAIELAAVLLALEAGDHLVDEVVDVEQLELDARVIDRIGQVVGKGVAEGRDGTVVVGPAPFAEKVREAVDQNARARLAAIIEEQILARLFAAAIFGVAEAARETGLLGAREHHRALVPVLFERIEKRRGEAEIARHKLFLVLRPVHARKVEYEVRLLAPGVELLRRGIEVIFIHIRNGHAVIAGFAVLDVVELCAEVPSHETLGAGNQNLHRLLSCLPIIGPCTCRRSISGSRRR